jgi:hypothetical protein
MESKEAPDIQRLGNFGKDPEERPTEFKTNRDAVPF